MRTITLYKGHDSNGNYFWSFEDLTSAIDMIRSYPYEVKIPDEFSIHPSVSGRRMFYRDGCDIGYDLFMVNNRSPYSKPVIMGGAPTEKVKLEVIRELF